MTRIALISSAIGSLHALRQADHQIRVHDQMVEAKSDHVVDVLCFYPRGHAPWAGL